VAEKDLEMWPTNRKPSSPTWSSDDKLFNGFRAELCALKTKFIDKRRTWYADVNCGRFSYFGQPVSSR